MICVVVPPVPAPPVPVPTLPPELGVDGPEVDPPLLGTVESTPESEKESTAGSPEQASSPAVRELRETMKTVLKIE